MQAQIVSGDTMVLITKILLLFNPLVPTLFMQSMFIFLGVENQHRNLIRFGYLVAFIFPFLLFFTDYIINGWRPILDLPSWPIAGPLLTPYLIFEVGYIIYTLIIAIQQLKYSDYQRQMQIKLMIFGIATGIIGGNTAFLLYQGIPIKAWGSPLAFLQLFLITYAIFRHGLLNIKSIAAEILSPLISVVLFFNLFLTNYQTTWQLILNIVLFLASILLSVFLIRSVNNELRMNTQLVHLNENLQQKVDEQTQEIRKAYEIEKKARLDLEKLDKAKDQFILTTQHHLRTPLTVLKGFLETALHAPDIKKVSRNFLSYLEKSSSATDRMTKLVNDFLNVSQLEIGKAVFHFKPVMVKALVQEIYEELKSEIAKKGLYFKLEFTPEAEVAVLSLDREPFKAAIMNLVDNSIKYTPAGGIIVSAKVLTHPIEKNKILEMRFQDTGIGLTPEEQEKLFESYFFRGAEAEKVYVTGRGIGLVLSKNIINAHNGKITVESAGPGQGATFIVMLPFE